MLDAGLDPNDMLPYRYPDPGEFEAAGLQIVYLGWFLGDWSLVNNAAYSCSNGLDIREDTVDKTGDLHGVTSLDEDWVTLNQMIKYFKFGFGRATDYVNEEIRLGRMSREAGISIVERFDGCCSDNYVADFCDYIGISVAAFWEKVQGAANRELFDIRTDGTIRPRFRVGIGL
jgi:hypothetical protein